MNLSKKAVFFFCDDLNKDPVAHNVFNYSKNLFNMKKTNIIIDDNPVMEFKDLNDNVFQYVRLKDVLSHDYNKYLPILNKYFSKFDFSGIVNWHEGKNAPNNILTVHTTGDVPTGVFGNSNPIYFKNLISAIESNRIKHNLNEFTTLTEATHWSGIGYESSTNLIDKYLVPLVDIEIGSSFNSWNNETAIKTLALSLPQVFSKYKKIHNLICVGGIHFENSFTNLILNNDYPVSIGHILPNQWIANENYENEIGLEKLEKCIKSVVGGVHGIVFHDNLKGIYKEQCRKVGTKLNIPVFKHKLLKDLEKLPIWEIK